MNLLRAILFRFRAAIFVFAGVIMITLGLPFTALFWLLSGIFLPFHFWKIADDLIDSI